MQERQLQEKIALIVVCLRSSSCSSTHTYTDTHCTFLSLRMMGSVNVNTPLIHHGLFSSLHFRPNAVVRSPPALHRTQRWRVSEGTSGTIGHRPPAALPHSSSAAAVSSTPSFTVGFINSTITVNAFPAPVVFEVRYIFVTFIYGREKTASPAG